MRYPRNVPAPDLNHVCCHTNNKMLARCVQRGAVSATPETGGAASSSFAAIPQYHLFNRHIDLEEQEAELARVEKAKTFRLEERRLSKLKEMMPEEVFMKLRNRAEKTDINLAAFNNYSANAFKLSQIEAVQQQRESRFVRENGRRNQLLKNKESVEENAINSAKERAKAELNTVEKKALLEEYEHGTRNIKSGYDNPYLSVLSDDYARAALGVDKVIARNQKLSESSRKLASEENDMELEAERAFRQDRTQLDSGSRGSESTISGVSVQD